MTKTSSAAHWEEIYERKGSEGVSWYRPHLERSLAFVREASLTKDAAIIDVGGGASTFVDDLVGQGFRNVTVVDLSARAIEAAKLRLGERAREVRWLVGDITRLDLPAASFDFWHDRAVFHFLGQAEARHAYVAQARDSVKPAGHVVVATFGPEGPQRCSGLEVVRYDADGIHAEFGDVFRRVSSAVEVHQTPAGDRQQFVYCYCRVAE